MKRTKGRARAEEVARDLLDAALHAGPCTHPVIESMERIGPHGPIETIQTLSCGRVHFCFMASAETVRLLERIQRHLAGLGRDSSVATAFEFALESLLDELDPRWRTRK